MAANLSSFDATNDDIKSFPLGLQIVSGNAQLRTAPSTSGAAQLDPSQGKVQPAQITCPRSGFNPASWPAGSDGSVAGIQDPNNQGSGIGFPFQDCDGYASPMRVDVHFPSCYDPSAGLTNFRNNMAFPTPAAGGKLDCPKGWIHVPHMFFETYWDTHAFAPRFQQLNGKASPFTFSNGDTTGFSAHGDFISGWDNDELQNIIDNCDAGHAGLDACPGLKLGVNDGSGSCNIKCPVDEVVDGKLEKLPGNNPLAGWALGGGSVAAPSSVAAPAPVPVPSTSSSSKPTPTPIVPPVVKSEQAPSSSSSSSASPPPPPSSTSIVLAPVPTTSSSAFAAEAVTTKSTTPPAQPTLHAGKMTTVYDTITVWQTKTVYADKSAPTQLAQDTSGSADIAGFKYVGCYKDSSSRVLSGEVLPNLGLVSNTACVNYCASKGFSIAGTEYGGECYCGNNLSTLEKLDESKCSKACKGDASQKCGGDWALTLYTESGALPGAYKRHMHHHLHHARMPSRHFRR
jgi:hypothetical protein